MSGLHDVRLGDLLQDHARLRVHEIDGDHAGCAPEPPDGEGLSWIPLNIVAAMPLLERDGTPITPPAAP